eukprot:962545-Pleurochrysis_carterae.AAC.7
MCTAARAAHAHDQFLVSVNTGKSRHRQGRGQCSARFAARCEVFAPTRAQTGGEDARTQSDAFRPQWRKQASPCHAASAERLYPTKSRQRSEFSVAEQGKEGSARPAKAPARPAATAAAISRWIPPRRLHASAAIISATRRCRRRRRRAHCLCGTRPSLGAQGCLCHGEECSGHSRHAGPSPRVCSVSTHLAFVRIE